MPEYMDYNDYEEAKTKRQKIFSRIGLSLAVLWLVFLVVWVNVRTPENLRSKFTAVSSDNHSFSEESDSNKNQFLILKKELESGKEMTLSSEFRKYYSDLYSVLLSNDKEIAKNVPMKFDSYGYLTLALPYVVSSHEDDSGITRRTLGVDVLMIPYECSAENGASVTIGESIRYSLRYKDDSDESVPYVVSEPFSAKRFRLSFYSLSVGFYTDENMSTLEYSAKLSHPLTKSESENFKLSKNISIKNSDKLESALVSGEGISDTTVYRRFTLPDKFRSELTAVINYDDLMYNKLDSITFTAANIKSGQFKITVN